MPEKKYTVKLDNPIKTDRINILMVDDSEENLLALEAVLSSPHYHLVKAKTGEAALKYILTYDFAVILLDVQMPGLNGFETAKLIKERKKSRNIPIIFITAISQDVHHILQGYKVGAIDYIVKPFNPEALKSKVKQFVQIYENHAAHLKEMDSKRSMELAEVNRELNLTKIDLTKNEVVSTIIKETLQDTIVMCDEQGLIISVNSMVGKMFGYTEEELLGTSIDILFHTTEIKNKDKEEINQIAANYVGKIVEVEAKRKNGTTFPSDLFIGEATVEDYHIYVCTIRDITERKEMEKIRKQQVDLLEQVVEERTLDLLLINQKLNKEIEERNKVKDDLIVSEGRFKQIFEASPCLMAIRSIVPGKVIAVNNNWITNTGFTNEECMSEYFNWEISKEDGNETWFSECEWHKPMSNVRVHYQTKSGAIRKGLLSTEIIKIENKNCVLIVLNDMTERYLMEKEISRLDRLNLVGEMAAGIAHEIRNPMTTVHGFLQMGKMDIQSLSLEHMDLMIDELDRANKIIKEFLTLAKNKTSDKKFQSLNKVIEIIHPLIHAEALLAGKKVVLRLEPCPLLLIDEKEIRQLLLNLALNGLEAMPNDGVLTIRTFVKGKEVVLEVEDNGSGIKEEVLDKIGTPFFTTKENGTGLGVAVCFSIADRHHAAIKIKSSNKGTKFSIHFTQHHSAEMSEN